MFIRYAAFHLQQLSAKRQRDTAEQKSIEANKETDTKEANETETKEVKRETKSQEKEKEPVKEKKQKKEDKKEKSAKKEEVKEGEGDKAEAKVEKKDDDLLLNENYSEIDTDVAKKIVESITDSICSGGDKQESDCEYNCDLLIVRVFCYYLMKIKGHEAIYNQSYVMELVLQLFDINFQFLTF